MVVNKNYPTFLIEKKNNSCIQPHHPEPTSDIEEPNNMVVDEEQE